MPKLSLTKLTDRPGKGEPVILKVGRSKAKPLEDLAAKHGIDVPGEILDIWIAKEEARLGNMDHPTLIAEYKTVTGRSPRSTKRKVITAAILRRLRELSRPTEPAAAAKPKRAPKVITPSPLSKAARTPKRSAKLEAELPSDKLVREGRTLKEQRPRDPRIPAVGLMIERVYKGKTLLVTVLDDGFEYEGKPYRSLSALAQAITGAKAINGHLFFRLGKYAKTPTAV